MRAFISSTVKALADFIEFDEAIALGAKRGALPPEKAKMAEATLETFYAKLKAAAGDVTRMNDLPWSVAESVVAERRSEAKRKLRQQALDREAARDMQELVASGAI